MKYAVEVAKYGSLNKASEMLLIAQPNLSRSIKELEVDLGITIFDRTSRGMVLTPEGEEFIDFAKGILSQIDQVEKYYRDGAVKKLRFSVSVPADCYISEAFAEFTKGLPDVPAEVIFQEASSQKTIQNLVDGSCNLGVIRYAENYDKYFRTLFDEKDFSCEPIADFSYRLIFSKNSKLAKTDVITLKDLKDLAEVVHSDFYVPSMPSQRVMKEELSYSVNRRIFLQERGCQLDLLSKNDETFMWSSSLPADVMERYGLAGAECLERNRIYKDVLLYRRGYKLTKLDKQFISALCDIKRKNRGTSR